MSWNALAGVGAFLGNTEVGSVLHLLFLFDCVLTQQNNPQIPREAHVCLWRFTSFRTAIRSLVPHLTRFFSPPQPPAVLALLTFSSHPTRRHVLRASMPLAVRARYLDDSG